RPRSAPAATGWLARAPAAAQLVEERRPQGDASRNQRARGRGLETRPTGSGAPRPARYGSARRTPLPTAARAPAAGRRTPLRRPPAARGRAVEARARPA